MIIGLAGAKRSGKNTVAQIIAEEFGDQYKVREWSFAEDLKKSAAAALGIKTDDPISWANSFKENGRIVINETKLVDTDHPYFQIEELIYQHEISGREYLQRYGTEAHREIFGDDFWVDNLLGKIQNSWITGSAIKERLDLITDVRFPNEAVAIMKQKGQVIRIRRPEVESTGDTHASEKPLPDELVSATIWNDVSIEELRPHAIEIIKRQILGVDPND